MSLAFLSTYFPQPSKFNWAKYASPHAFYPLAGKLIPWFATVAILLIAIGLYIGFFIAPTDHQQGDAYRIIFLHVPAAWLSILIYIVMAFWSGIGLIFNTRLSAMMAQSLAPTGAMFTLLALITGALWGRPTWGTWWVWDARLTSELILFFLYIGFMCLHAAIDDIRRADKAAGLFALVGIINVPIIYFSVQWWNTLHQGASISFRNAPTMASIMLAGIFITTLGLWSYSITITLLRLRCIVIEREPNLDWIK